jgi:hypothetical protein
MIDVIDIIRRMEEDKRSRNVEPPYVLHSEIMNEIAQLVKDELNQAVTGGTLEFHRTINGVSFNIKDK